MLLLPCVVGACADPCLCEDDAQPAASACVDRSFDADGAIRKALDLYRGESCADVLESAGGHGGITATELCRMPLSDFASNIGSYSLVSGLSWTPPVGFTYVADLCAATCGSLGIGATACGGTGSVSPFSGASVITATTASFRARLAAAPTLLSCAFYWGPMGPVTYPEELWFNHCGNPTVIYLAAGTFSLGGAQLELREKTVTEIVGHPSGSTIDAQSLSRIFDQAPDAQLTLKNVILINGRADYGGAIRIDMSFPAGMTISPMTAHHLKASRLTMKDSAIRNCQATIDGGAIASKPQVFAFGVDMNLRNIEISGCSAANKGGAIFLTQQNLNIADSTFSNNNATSGGAIAFDSTMTAQIKRSRFTTHTATGTGGTMNAVGAGLTAVLLSDVIVDTSTADTGGAFNAEGATLECTRCFITASTATSGLPTYAGAGFKVGSQEDDVQSLGCRVVGENVHHLVVEGKTADRRLGREISPA